MKKRFNDLNLEKHYDPTLTTSLEEILKKPIYSHLKEKKMKLKESLIKFQHAMCQVMNKSIITDGYVKSGIQPFNHDVIMNKCTYWNYCDQSDEEKRIMKDKIRNNMVEFTNLMKENGYIEEIEYDNRDIPGDMIEEFNKNTNKRII